MIPVLRRSGIRYPDGSPRRRDPITMSAPFSMAARRFGISEGTCCPSASISTTVPYPRETAYRSPVCTAAPYPRFTGWERTVTGRFSSSSRDPSVDPSSTMTMSQWIPAPRISSTVARRFISSLKTGRTMAPSFPRSSRGGFNPSMPLLLPSGGSDEAIPKIGVPESSGEGGFFSARPGPREAGRTRRDRPSGRSGTTPTPIPGSR